MVHDTQNGAKVDQNAGFLWKTYHYCLIIASLRPHIYTQTCHKVQEATTLKKILWENCRVGYDPQKVAEIEQKTGFKENVNHDSRQNFWPALVDM